MKRIILCFDGAWNIAADDGLDPALRVGRNVRRFRRVRSTHGKETTDRTVNLRRGDAELAYASRNPGIPEPSATAIA